MDGESRTRLNLIAENPGVRAAALLTCLWLGCGLPGLALEPTTPLASYARQAWGMENGLPQNTVQALAQTRDGFVWIGTEVGLVRFDGNGFQVFDKNSTPALPGNDVRCLLETGDGALWIGTSEGLARWRDGSVTAFAAKDGLPGDVIRGLAELPDGVLWVSTDTADAEFRSGQFVAVQIEKFKLAGRPFVKTSGGESIPMIVQWSGIPFDQIASSAILRNGIAAVASTKVLAIPHGDIVNERYSVGRELPGTRIQALFADREGYLWIGTNGGLARWVGGKVELFPITDPLAKASILSLMEDREGNLWVGTETGGLHILRDQRFHTIGAPEGLTSDATTTIVEGLDGKLWIGSSGGGLNVVRPRGIDPGAARTYAVRDVLLSDVILSLVAAPNGDIWVGTPDGLNRIRGSAVDAFTSADGLPDDFIRSLLADADGSLWIGTRRGLTHMTLPDNRMGPQHPGLRLKTFTQADGLGSDLVGAMVRDARGDLWVATLAGLSRIHSGAITNYTTANGLSSNVITALLLRANGTLLIGTQDHGWNLWDGQRFSASMHDGLDKTSIHAILDDGGGHLWFATGNGIARCDCGGAGMMQAGCTHWVEFSAADGLRSRETATNSHPSAARTRDGHLWFATPKGIVEVDPAHFSVNTLAPPVELERFAVDDIPQALHAADSSIRIPSGHVHFEFDYAGLSFIAPQKVRYRYKLEGFDKDWTEAGARRTAYYTTIPPGKYTFRVQAENNDGVWNIEGAALRFELRPHFYQTLWFYAVVLLAVAALAALALRRRLLHAEREFNAVLGERSRIAREIHDTLAQGYVGVSVQLEVLSQLLRQNKTEAAAKHLDATREIVRAGLADARQSIWALRTQDAAETTLPVKLRRLAESADGHGLAASFSIFGAYRPLPPGTEQEILRVAQEAIQNVKKHAGAAHLSVQVEYRPTGIALEIRDDGKGFAAGEKMDSPPGHYGLTGMRERAAMIGGRLEVSSEPGAGTVVRLTSAQPKEKDQARNESKEKEQA
jgi:signal transduction histidine kinase/ligand-binding sensor domain-containing protein